MNNKAVYWCNCCLTPIIKKTDKPTDNTCPYCKRSTLEYMASDIRPVFPEEKRLIELAEGYGQNYLDYIQVWASKKNYFIDFYTGIEKNTKNFYVGDVTTSTGLIKINCNKTIEKMKAIKYVPTTYNNEEDEETTNFYILNFIEANEDLYNEITNEARAYIKETFNNNPSPVIVSFSGGKDSTVVASLVKDTINNDLINVIFGDTTLELPFTYEYVNRFIEDNKDIKFAYAYNEEQKFLEVCEDIGAPSRVNRWCCSMFKTAPFNRVLNYNFSDKVLTFLGIRKAESVARSTYARTSSTEKKLKIAKKISAFPIIDWLDIEVWLYIFTKKLDFNYAYKLGYTK